MNSPLLMTVIALLPPDSTEQSPWITGGWRTAWHTHAAH